MTDQTPPEAPSPGFVSEVAAAVAELLGRGPAAAPADAPAAAPDAPTETPAEAPADVPTEAPAEPPAPLSVEQRLELAEAAIVKLQSYHSAG